MGSNGKVTSVGRRRLRGAIEFCPREIAGVDRQQTRFYPCTDYRQIQREREREQLRCALWYRKI
uniref:Uncharacterized protein n=1 Tax=Rhizophora mucronata TaxID=61149 RepID=A0A2P2PL42_RHIMU